jgi:glycosyltransferase involved in cell wall biosynthesis
MKLPLVSVVVETVTPATSAGAGGSLAERLAAPLQALAAQTYPGDRVEPILVLGGEISARDGAEVARRFPDVTIVRAAAGNYFDAKNVGARAARGGIVTFLDGDCTPDPDWLERIVERFADGPDAVAGYCRYAPRHLRARILTVPAFAYVFEDEDGGASGFNFGNVAFRRDVLVAHPLDPRLSREAGGCYTLYHQLKAVGLRIDYEPRARVAHAVDFSGLGFFVKHWRRGYCGLDAYRVDAEGLLRGTRWYRRFGVAALLPISGRRILIDWQRLVRHRRQMGVALPALPLFALLAATLRTVELAGAIAAHMRKRTDTPPLVSVRGRA